MELEGKLQPFVLRDAAPPTSAMKQAEECGDSSLAWGNPFIPPLGSFPVSKICSEMCVRHA